HLRPFRQVADTCRPVPADSRPAPYPASPKKLSSLAVLLVGLIITSLWQCWPSAASARETDEKRCSNERARPDDVRRSGGKRVSSQLPQLPKQKSGHSRRAERNNFIEHRREFWLLD